MNATTTTERSLVRLSTALAQEGHLDGASTALDAQTIDQVVNEADQTKDWCNAMGCADHMRTRASLHIVYTYVEEGDGSIVAKPSSAYISGEDTTWTDLKLQGFHGTSQVFLEPVAFQTTQHTYGVDGQWIPSPVGSKRTDLWREEVPLATALADRSQKGGVMKVNFSKP